MNQNRATKLFTDTMIPRAGTASRIRYNRENLISAEVADELNTYRTWGEFTAFAEIYTPEYDKDGNEVTDENTPIGAPATRSIFNKSGAVLLGNTSFSNPTEGSSDYRVSHNVPLIDAPNNRIRQRNATACSVRDLVQASEQGLMGQATYSYSDFMYCKWLGLMPNTYMVTLRRFPLPVEDFISSIGTSSSIDDQTLSNQYPSIGCMVTWMGTPGNEMNNILKYSVSMPYEFKEMQEEDDIAGGAEEHGGVLNTMANALNASYRARYAEGMVGAGLNGYIGNVLNGMSRSAGGGGSTSGSSGTGVLGKALGKAGSGLGALGKMGFGFGLGGPPYRYKDLMFARDRHKIYGPVDVIKGVYSRGKSGIKFDQKITLTFDYEMRSYDGINQKQAFLDLLSNILNVIYTTGTFWGGGYRIIGQPQNDIFTSLNIFKSGGDTSFTGMVNTLWGDAKNLFNKLGGQQRLNNLTSNAQSDIQTVREEGFGAGLRQVGERMLSNSGNFLQNALNILNGVGGMLLGGWLNKLGRPHLQFVNSLLSPAPTGFWHLMIGNPRDPIMSLGNMIITSANIEHYGPLGIDDFPTGLKVTVELERGKPRDIRDIERMYMKGSDRIYVSMGEKVMDMYKYAKEYKGSGTTVYGSDGQNADLAATEPAQTVRTGDGTAAIDPSSSQSSESIMQEAQILMKYFGTSSPDSIIVTATEQESGSQRLKSPAGTGDQGSGGGIMAI